MTFDRIYDLIESPERSPLIGRSDRVETRDGCPRDKLQHRYSLRRATAGSTLVADLAGINEATKPTQTNSTTTKP